MGGANRHYERAFEAMLTRARVPHLLVDDARRALLPPGAAFGSRSAAGAGRRVKSFDAVVYGSDEIAGTHLLTEVKGRRVDLHNGSGTRRESWTTGDDVASLRAWEQLFGGRYEGVLVFLYWLDGPPPKALGDETFRFEGRAYAHRAVRVAEYARLMRVRSPRWGTVSLAAADFEAVSRTLWSLLEPASGTIGGRNRRSVACGVPVA